jgi:hypothetical protein
MHARSLIFCPILIACLSAYAQENRNTGFFGNAMTDTRVCPQGSNFMSEEDVSGLVSEMLGRIGAMNRYVIIACPQVENCQATVFNGRPYILYNPVFLQSVRSLNFSSREMPSMQERDWEALTILAHELGHHINNHLTNPLPGSTQQDLELEADRSAGFMIYLLGGNLAQASAAYARAPEKGGYTHPARTRRLEALALGWNDASRKYPRSSPVPSASVVKEPVPGPVREPVKEPVKEPVRPAGKLELKDDPSIPTRPADFSRQEENQLYEAKQAYSKGDYATAKDLFTGQKLSSNPEAQYYLGLMYEFGKGVDIKPEEAFRLFKLSAGKGFGLGIQSVARFHQKGSATPKDDFEATRWYYLCALRGEATCLASMASRYMYGLGVEKDYAEAMRWARLAVDKKSSYGYLYMGTIYENGMGVEKDLAEAAQWYRKAADMGNSIASERLQKLSSPR